MADNVMFNVRPDFNMEAFSQRLAEMYRAKGYTVNAAMMNGCSIITFDKGTGGINTLLGMGEGIKATCTRMGDTVNISFSDAEWTGKIVGLAIGWILCFVPFITALIGVVRQTSLPTAIGNDAVLIASQC